MQYTVYKITPPSKKKKYFGSTMNFKSRMSLHKSRFNENTDGSNAKVYIELRKEVDDFDDCIVEVLGMFNNKTDAESFEQSLISKQRKLNPKNLLNAKNVFFYNWLYE